MGKDSSKGKTFKESVKYYFVDSELIGLSKELASHNKNMAELQNEKAHVGAQFKERATKLEADISMASRKVSDGYEFRMADCFWEFYWKKGKKNLIRLDTGDIVLERDITADDRQMRLEEDINDSETGEQPA